MPRFKRQDGQDRQERIKRIIDAVIRQRADGQSVTIKEIVAQHPDLAPDLGRELLKLETIGRGGDRANEPNTDPLENIRCPQCREPIDIDPTADNLEAACVNCGSLVNLVTDTAPTISYRYSDRTHSLETIGRFKILDAAGAGAFGKVYRARDPQLDRIVAIKVPRTGNLTTDEEVDRFVREGQNAAQLRHRGIVSVFDVDFHDDLPFVVSEFVAGLTLSDRLRISRPSARDSAQICAQVADALDYAHEHGIVHRDVKPSNILIDEDGSPRIMDFGIAKRDTGEVTMTMEGQILGTPAYMSPEQADGRSHDVDGRSDVYSVGVILYEMLTGERPFRGNHRMLIHQTLHDEPKLPRSINDKVPPDLETITMKAMSKEPEKRYETADSLSDDLGRWMKGEPIQARPVGSAERLWRWCKRNPTVAGLTGIAVALLVAVAVVSTVGYIRTEAARAEVELSLYYNRIALAYREWRTANTQAVGELLEECPPHLRHWEWGYLFGLCNLGQLQVTENFEITSVAFSPDGSLIASSSPKGRIKIRDSTTGEVVANPKGHSKFVSSVAFSPNGNWLASGSQDSTVKVWDVSTGGESFSLTGHESLVSNISFTRDSARIAAAGTDGTIIVWDLRTRESVLAIKGPPIVENSIPITYSIALNPDCTRFGSGSSAGTIRLWNAETDEATLDIEQIGGSIQCVALSPDGARFAVGAHDSSIRIWDADTGGDIGTLNGHSYHVLSLGFSPDGNWLASGSGDNTIKLWDLGKHRAAATLRGHGGAVLSVAYSPDGRRIVSGSQDRTIRFWDVAEILEADSRTGHKGYILGVAYSPDGRRIASAGLDGTVRLWDGASGDPILTLEQDGGSVGSVVFSSDGRRLISGSKDGNIRVWDIKSRRLIQTLIGHSMGVRTVAVAPDGRWIASGSVDQLIKLWESETGQEIRSLKGHENMVSCVAFNPDGRRIASGSTDEIKVWNAETGQEIKTLVGHSGLIKGLSFSPDGRWLASASNDHTVKLWIAETGELVRELKGHSDQVVSVAFSPDGKRIVTSSVGRSNNTIRLWDPETGQEVMVIDQKANPAMSVAFSPDGRRIVLGGRSGRIEIWDTLWPGESRN
jgi:WD40 repeat protein/tRNA A-37 threonylcarbamoyl transferase component Bud32